jgi:hypothetical protein
MSNLFIFVLLGINNWIYLSKLNYRKIKKNNKKEEKNRLIYISYLRKAERMAAGY